LIKTFSYRRQAEKNEFSLLIHSVDIETSFEKWLTKIFDLQNEFYSFNKMEVDNIKKLYSENKIHFHFDKAPYYFTFPFNEKIEVVKIEQVIKSNSDIVAKVTYLTTEQGGRIGYAASGYRPHMKFSGKKELTSGEQLFVDKDKVFPGETVVTEIRMLCPDFYKKHLTVGQSFEVSEGPKLVGYGEIIEIINLELQKA